jgi:hypothetical protein
VRNAALWAEIELSYRLPFMVAQAYLDGVPHLQHLPSGSALCLPVMAAKK